MKTPKFGFNKIQSFIDFFNNIGRIRLGSEGKRIFVESEFNSVQSKQYLTNENGVPNFVANAVFEDFDGTVDLSRSHTIYKAYGVEAPLEIGFKTDPAPIPGGYAELTLYADGVVTPTFGATMHELPGSTAYDPTLGVLNKVGIYFDGYIVWYTNTVIV